MTAKHRHPTWKAWQEWVRGTAADAEKLRVHADRCAACRAIVETLRQLSAYSTFAPGANKLATPTETTGLVILRIRFSACAK